MDSNYFESVATTDSCSRWAVSKTRWNRSVQQCMFTLSFIAFLLLGTHVSAQIIVERGTNKANFGIDADVEANFNAYTFSGNTLNVNQLSPGTDDWFLLGTAGSGKGIIDISNVGPTGNNPVTFGMSEPQFFTNNSRVWLDAIYVRDPNSAGNNKDFSVFQGNSNKNADNPGSWNIVNSSTPQKNDLIDIYGHLRRDLTDPLNPKLWAFLAASTRSGDGSAYLDFEFFRENLGFDIGASDLQNLGPDGGHTAWQFAPDASITQLGDLIISLDFENGGTVIAGHVYIWVDPTSLPGGGFAGFNALAVGNSDLKFEFVQINNQFVFESGNGAGNFGYAEIQLKDFNLNDEVAFAQINLGPVNAPSWGTLTGPQANNVTQYPDFTLVEFGFNLTDFGFDLVSLAGSDDDSNQCGPLFGGVLVKTRSSASFTSELKDLAGPFPFGNVEEATVTIDGVDIECNEPFVVLTAQTNVPFGLQYQWYVFDDTLQDYVELPGETNPTLNAVAGTYKVEVTAPGINGPGTGCVSEDTFTVNEIIPPVVVVDCPADTSIPACQSQADVDLALSNWFNDFTFSGGQGTLTATYTFNGNVIDINTFQLPSIDNCAGGSFTISLEVEDECNQIETCSSTFSVAPDVDDPVITAQAQNQTVQCDGQGNDTELQAWLSNNGGAVATDNCNNVTWSNDFSALTDDCGATGSATVTFTATDDCGNTSTTTATFTIEDTTDPSIDT
ncbi:MAG: hypothetical protein RQ756_05990, partial [Flavobacteriaceae bacterium]|nr:hypothetical protein [Flavobacteriaceae bacterium]